MNLTDIANIRLISQQISGTKIKTAKEIVAWMGAFQAQDYAMAKWALGTRLSNLTDADIESAIDKGEIIRTHLLRPTWHLVSADDIYWMLELTAAHVKALMKSPDKNLELSESIYKKSDAIIEKSLDGGKHLTREELMTLLEKNKIATNSNRSSHLMLRAELDGIVCSGSSNGAKRTYALLAERVPKKKTFNREEALAELAKKYFLSHCPATLKDFIWWSGLSVKDAKNALDMVRSVFISEIIDSETYWFHPSYATPNNNKSSVHLLPAFDEFIISYKNRNASLTVNDQKKVFTSNGIFRPMIVINGQVKGLWKRSIKKDKVIVETDFFQTHHKVEKDLVEEAAASFAKFLNKKAQVNHTS